MKKRFYSKHVKIGGVEYSIAWAKTVDKDGETRGTCDSTVRQITLRDNMNERLTFETFIHEALHAIIDSNKLSITHGNINELEEPLAAFILDNFHIVPKR
jgi:hypothetical protein